MREITVTKQLPEWADVVRDEVRGMDFVVVNVDEVYPRVVELLLGKPTRYWAEIARRCVTKYLQELLGPYNLKLVGSAWSLQNLPDDGDPEPAAVTDRAGNVTLEPEYLAHYQRIKGQLAAL